MLVGVGAALFVVRAGLPLILRAVRMVERLTDPVVSFVLAALAPRPPRDIDQRSSRERRRSFSSLPPVWQVGQ